MALLALACTCPFEVIPVGLPHLDFDEPLNPWAILANTGQDPDV